MLHPFAPQISTRSSSRYERLRQADVPRGRAFGGGPSVAKLTTIVLFSPIQRALTLAVSLVISVGGMAWGAWCFADHDDTPWQWAFAALAALSGALFVICLEILWETYRRRRVPASLRDVFLHDPPGWKIVCVGAADGKARFRIARRSSGGGEPLTRRDAREPDAIAHDDMLRHGPNEENR